MTADGRPCLYDDAARAALGGNPPAIASVRGSLDAAQTALLDAAGALLAASTAALRDAARAAGASEVLLLAYLPGVLDGEAPEIRRANLPVGWASPAYDVLQLEDYDWVTAGDGGATARALSAIGARLGYPIAQTHYLSGFVLHHEAAPLWARIDAAAAAARGRGHAEVFVWALPQVTRDGFIHFDLGEEGQMQAFDDVDFPIAIGRTASAEPGFFDRGSSPAPRAPSSATPIGRRRGCASTPDRAYVAPADIQALLGFFRARRGAGAGLPLPRSVRRQFERDDRHARLRRHDDRDRRRGWRRGSRWSSSMAMGTRPRRGGSRGRSRAACGSGWRAASGSVAGRWTGGGIIAFVERAGDGRGR